MQLAAILGYQIDMTRCAMLRSLHRLLSDCPAGNRSVGMKVASRLEVQGLLTRRAGGNGRTRGLHITPTGEQVLADLLSRHERSEALLAAGLTPEERDQLVVLLAKVRQAVEAEEVGLRRSMPLFAASSKILPRQRPPSGLPSAAEI